MENSSDQIVRPLTLKYAVALGLVAALAGANLFILRTTIHESERLASIVDQAGRQRMSLHRTAIHAERFVFSLDESGRSRIRGELLADVRELEKTHHELMEREVEQHGESADDAIRAIYENAPWLLDSEMRNYLLHVRSLTDSEPDELTFENPHFTYIRNQETIDKIRDGLEAVVDAYGARRNAKTRQLNLLAIWSFASTLALLLLDGCFVFRPMVRKVRKDVVALNDLNETLEQRIAERTAESEQRAAKLAESEAALRVSEAFYSSLVRHMPMAVLRKDRDGRYTFANDRFSELVGKPMKKLIGRTDADFYSPELAGKYREDDLHVMTKGTVFQGVEEHQSHDGRQLSVEVLKVALRDPDQNVIGTQTMFWDVTDRKEAERRAMQAERLAAIGQMVTGVAHESRNALQQIQACSQLLKWELDGDEKKKELITDLQRAEERLLRLFEELRGYAAPMKLDRKPCDIRNVIADAWSAIEQQRDGRDVAFCDNASDLSTRCVADPLKLEQVFRNLFENAVFACDDPVRIEVTYETLDGDFLRITISDNGPGLTAEQQSRIFEPFFTTNTQGTGLGMAIVKRIVDAHSGQIRAESNGTNGAAMVVTLPSGLSPSWRTPREDNQRARAT